MHRADFRSLCNKFRCLRIAVTPNGGDERKSNPANWQCWWDWGLLGSLYCLDLENDLRGDVSEVEIQLLKLFLEVPGLCFLGKHQYFLIKPVWRRSNHLCFTARLLIQEALKMSTDLLPAMMPQITLIWEDIQHFSRLGQRVQIRWKTTGEYSMIKYYSDWTLKH